MLHVIVTAQFEIVVKNDILGSFSTFILLKMQMHFLQWLTKCSIYLLHLLSQKYKPVWLTF